MSQPICNKPRYWIFLASARQDGTAPLATHLSQPDNLHLPSRRAPHDVAPVRSPLIYTELTADDFQLD
jgi:hypothetical protein